MAVDAAVGWCGQLGYRVRIKIKDVVNSKVFLSRREAVLWANTLKAEIIEDSESPNEKIHVTEHMLLQSWARGHLWRGVWYRGKQARPECHQVFSVYNANIDTCQAVNHNKL